MEPSQKAKRKMKIITDERCTEYCSPGHPERPARISRTLEKLRSQNDLPITWAKPLSVNNTSILRAHDPAMLERLMVGERFDGDTPYFPDIDHHTQRSIGGALAALKAARAGEPVFSLMRPPGHHATRNQSMGFCYLNSIAIAVLEGLATGTKKVAVFDFDVHHGNGTEDILLNQPGAAFFSVHQSPCYPGTGTRDVGDNCFNFPVPPATPRQQYRKVLATALDGVKQFKPGLLAVSAGFDAYADDPLAQETLELEDFYWLGQSIRQLGVPVFSILEGGYSDELPELILTYLKGLEGL
jgi:acetoin utilization deacetylase AcuC-like enzyme